MPGIALRVLCAGVLAACLCACSGGGQSASDEYQRVVYHINYPDVGRQASVLRNIKNHLNAVGEANVEMKVVVHGKGLSLLRTEPGDARLQGLIRDLRRRDVRFLVCKHSLERQSLDYARDMFEVSPSDVVPSGVVALAQLQREGYTYLKP